MFNFLRGRGKKPGDDCKTRRGDIDIAEFINAEKDFGNYLNLIDDTLMGCVLIFKMRVDENVFSNPDPRLAPQQSLKREWDLFVEKYAEDTERLKREISSRISGGNASIHASFENIKDMIGERIGARIATALEKYENEAKSYLGCALDRIHASERAAQHRPDRLPSLTNSRA